MALCLMCAGWLAQPAALAQSVAPTGAPTGASSDPTMDSPLKALSVVVGGSVTHDSNVFRRPGLLLPIESETITRASVGLRMDKAWSLQHFQLDITKGITRYDKSTHLDFDPLSYNGAWSWTLGTRLSGTLSASQTESLSFEDTSGLGLLGALFRNVRRQQNQAFDLAWSLRSGWYLTLGVSQSKQKSEINLLNRTPDFRATSGNVGVKYVTRAGNTIAVSQTRSDGDYIDRPIGLPNNGYTQDQTTLSANWKLTGNSTLGGSLGRLKNTNNASPGRDFSGKSSSLYYSWTPAGKLSLTVAATRNTTALQSLTASNRQEDSLTVTPTWNISAKTSAYLGLNYRKSQDRDVLIALPTGPRVDTTNSATLGVNWSATRRLTLNATAQRLQRTSTDFLSEYDATVAGINASFAF